MFETSTVTTTPQLEGAKNILRRYRTMAQLTNFEFVSPLAEAYYRNNRSSGQKSLRCFPHCNEKGHSRSSFCGTHVEATAVILKSENFRKDWQNKQVLIIAEIRPYSEQRISALQTVSKSKILNELRDMRNPRSGGELVLGKIEVLAEDSRSASVRLIFNSEKHSWDYSWKSNRWSGSTAPHVIDVILLESFNTALEDTDLRIHSSAVSRPFILISSHKSSGRKVTSSCCGRTKKSATKGQKKSDCALCEEVTFIEDDAALSDDNVSKTHMVRPSCYIYDIKHEEEMRRQQAFTPRPYFCEFDIVDRVIVLSPHNDSSYSFTIVGRNHIT